MNSTNTFQIGLLAAFVLFALIGFAAFTMLQPERRSGPTIEMWGKLPSSEFRRIADQVGDNAEFPFRVDYTEIRGDIREQLVEALAEGSAPDTIIFDHTQLLELEQFLVTIPHSSFSQRTYRDSFVEATEVFLADNGIMAVPFAVDPLVMYWNRDIYNKVGISEPPQYWGEMPNVVNTIIEKDDAGNIDISAVALGEYRNITNAKGIISTLLLQGGNPITRYRGNNLTSALGGNIEQSGNPTRSAIRFYTEFSDPVKTVYSWNRSLPPSQEMFIANDLATYFGYASELRRLREANPNLNFEVAPMPQIRDTDTPTVFGKVYGFGIVNQSSQPNDVLSALQILDDPTAGPKLADLMNGVTVRRDVIAAGADNAYTEVFYDSSLITSVWRDPDPEETADIFEEMIDNITSGRFDVSASINRAHSQLGELLRE